MQTLDRPDDVGTDLRMPPHPRHLVLGERHRLTQDTVGDPDLSHVVENGAEPDRANLVPGEPHPLGAGAGKLGQPLGVAAGVGVLGLDGIGQGHVDLGHQLGLEVTPGDQLLVRGDRFGHHRSEHGDHHEQEQTLQDGDSVEAEGGDIGPGLQRCHRTRGQVEDGDDSRGQDRPRGPEPQRRHRDHQEEQACQRAGVSARGVGDHGGDQHVHAGGRVAERAPGRAVKEEQEQGGQTDHAPGGQDGVDLSLIVAGGGIQVVEDDRKDQQGPAEKAGEPLVAEVDQAFCWVLGATPGVAQGISGSGHRRELSESTVTGCVTDRSRHCHGHNEFLDAGPLNPPLSRESTPPAIERAAAARPGTARRPGPPG